MARFYCATYRVCALQTRCRLDNARTHSLDAIKSGHIAYQLHIHCFSFGDREILFIVCNIKDVWSMLWVS